MIGKLNISGVSKYGKLWTGTRLQNSHSEPGSLWDGEKNVPSVVDAHVLEKTCACGATTRKFIARPISASKEGLAAFGEMAEIFVTSGGVGSITTNPELDCRLTVWNWSHRIGGHVVVNPLAVIGGRVNESELPPVKSGYRWISTYIGSTMAEYILVVDNDGIEQQPEQFVLPAVKVAGECPPCRQRREEAASLTAFSPEVNEFLRAVQDNAPDCSSRKKRLMEFAAAGDEAGMIAMTTEIREWAWEHLDKDMLQALCDASERWAAVLSLRDPALPTGTMVRRSRKSRIAEFGML